MITHQLLTQREREVLALLGAGKRNREIAAALWISENGVESHLKNIYRKLGVRNRVEAVLRAAQIRAKEYGKP